MNQTPRASNLKLKRFENAIGTPFPSLQQQSTGVYQRLIYSNFSGPVRLRHVFGNHSFIKSYGSEQWISEIFPPYTRTFNKKKRKLMPLNNFYWLQIAIKRKIIHYYGYWIYLAVFPSNAMQKISLAHRP